MSKHLFIGGLVAAGFDQSEEFLFTVSHAGRGVFAVSTWERVARDSELAYPEGGHAVGIGPIEGQRVKVKEQYEGTLELHSPDGSHHLAYDSSTVTISEDHHA